MTDYDHVTAEHYAAYRPPLHGPILASVLGQEERFTLGLDVGCGTGHSTHALAAYCDRTLGLEPSDAMLALARPAETLNFLHQRGARLSADILEDSVADIVTFAGSLFYRDTATTFAALKEMVAPRGTVVVYDFDVELGPTFAYFTDDTDANTYDHERNFDAFVGQGFRLENRVTQTMTFTADANELVHLLCSVPDWRRKIAQTASVHSLAIELHMIKPSWTFSARTFASRYVFNR